MEFNENLPIYLQIISYIEEQILTKNWSSKKKVPSVRELAKELQVNPGTVQKAYADLEQRKILITIRGIGKQVTMDQQIIKTLRENRLEESLTLFCDEMKQLNMEKKIVIEKILGRQW